VEVKSVVVLSVSILIASVIVAWSFRTAEPTTMALRHALPDQCPALPAGDLCWPPNGTVAFFLGPIC
jgi:hypothetical protein